MLCIEEDLRRPECANKKSLKVVTAESAMPFANMTPSALTAKTAQEEFAEVANETKEAFRAISQDTQRTVKQAASRITNAVEATKQAVIADEEDTPSRPAFDPPKPDESSLN